MGDLFSICRGKVRFDQFLPFVLAILASFRDRYPGPVRWLFGGTRLEIVIYGVNGGTVVRGLWGG